MSYIRLWLSNEEVIQGGLDSTEKERRESGSNSSKGFEKWDENWKGLEAQEGLFFFFFFFCRWWEQLRRGGKFSDAGKEDCGDPRTKEQIKPRRVLECRKGKTRPLWSFPPLCCNYWWISRPPEQYNLSPLLPHREKFFALLFPTPSMHASFNQQMTCKTPIPLLVPWL